MTKTTQILIGLPILAIAFPVGYFIAMMLNVPEPEAMPVEIKEVIQEVKEEQTETEEKLPLPKIQEPKVWTYCFPDFKTGRPVPIEAVSVEEARKQAVILGIGTEEVLSTWRGKNY